MMALEVFVCAMVLYGQRVMLAHPGRSNIAWLIANVLLIGVALNNANYGLVAMYTILSFSNIDLLSKLRNVSTAGE